MVMEGLRNQFPWVREESPLGSEVRSEAILGVSIQLESCPEEERRVVNTMSMTLGLNWLRTMIQEVTRPEAMKLELIRSEETPSEWETEQMNQWFQIHY
jgi:hypothetical protein